MSNYGFGSRLVSRALAGLILAMLTILPARAEWQSGYVAVDGGNIWWVAEGLGESDAPALLYIHGGPGGTHNGGRRLRGITDERALVLYDQLDSGESDRTGDTDLWNLDHFVDEIDHIRARLGLERVIVLGHSWGGAVATAYAARKPDGLVGVVLSSPLVSTPVWIEDANAYRAQLPLDVQAVLAEHEADGSYDDPAYRAAERVYLKRHLCRIEACWDGSGGPSSLNYDIYLHMWGPTEFFATGTLVDLDLTAQLKSIEVPVLVICGEFDEAAPATCARFAEMTGNGRAVTVPGAGHATIRENTAFYLAALRSFFADNGF